MAKRGKDIPISLVPIACSRDCPDRAFDCHVHCERYAAQRAKCDEEIAKRLSRRQAQEAISDAIKRMPGLRKI